MTSNDIATLYTLGERGQTVDGSGNDVRGREVKDKAGEGIGKVADLLVDDREKKVRFLLVEHGGFLGFGEKKTLIPVDAVTKITEFEVFVDQSRDRVAGGRAMPLISSMTGPINPVFTATTAMRRTGGRVISTPWVCEGCVLEAAASSGLGIVRLDPRACATQATICGRERAEPPRRSTMKIVLIVGHRHRRAAGAGRGRHGPDREAVRGGFGYVVGVDRIGQAAQLRAHGAGVVLTDLADPLVGGR